MHNEQQAHADKLANRALARAEEKQLEKGSDQSGFTKVERFQKLLPGAGGTGGGRGGGPGMGIGGKAATGALVKAVGKRGAQRVGTRLAAKYGGKAAAKTVGKYGAKTAAKVGLGGAAKIGAGAIAKSVGKKIPLVGLGLGAIFAAQRALEGDFVGAGLELASGAASTVPGLGTAGSIGIDAALAARDMGMTPFAKGGIITQPTNALMGEAGKEGVFPLEGSRGKKTFEMFGEGIFEAQKDAKDEFAKVQAAGLKFYFQNQNGFKFFGNLLKTVFAPFLEPLKALGNLKNAGGGLLNYLFGLGDNDTKNKRGGVNGRSRMVGPPPPVTGTGDLFDVIASGEGGYESINRGVAGDTPGGAKSVFAKNLSDMTVGEVMDLQAQDKLFAVGKYQIIPKTMKGFVRTMKIDMNDKFDSTTQEKFKKYVIDFKRPAVGKYLRGETNDRAEAAQELAREFASIGLAYNEAGRVRGESRYSGRAGNAASISPEEIEAALDRGRNNQIPEYDPSAKYKTGDLVIKNGQVRQFDGMGWAAADGVSAQNLGPQAQASNPNTGTPIMATSAQVARAGSTASSPTIINNYYTTANSSGGGVNSNGVAAGIGMNDTGTAAFTELRLRTLA